MPKSASDSPSLAPSRKLDRDLQAQPETQVVIDFDDNRAASALVGPYGQNLALIEDDRRYLEMRVARLDTGMAWGEDPPSRTRHLIGNLVAEPLDNGEVKAKTAFLVYRSHLETDHQLLAGSREDVLRRVNGAWKIAKRTILLDANVLLDKNLSIFL